MNTRLPSDADSAQTGGPLAGITVADMTRFLPGSLATQLLADLGADVIKVEPFPHGDFARGMQPAVAFSALNRGKRSLLVDFRKAQGVDVIRRLAAISDVFVEVSRPGVMARLGLDYDALRAIRPDIIYCSVSGYGQTGAYADIPSHNCNIDGLAGMLDVQRATDGSALLGPAAQMMPSGLIGGHAAAMGICATLMRRSITGVGAFIDASCWDAAVSGDPVNSAVALNDVPEVAGFGSRATPKYAPYWTADGHALMVCVMEHKFWSSFCALIGADDLVDAFGGTDDFGSSAPWVYDRVAAILVTKTRAQWMAVIGNAGLPVTPVHSRAEALASDNARDRGIRAEGVYTMAGPGLLIDGQRGGDTTIPGPGADTTEMLAKLGYSQSEITALTEMQVIG